MTDNMLVKDGQAVDLDAMMRNASAEQMSTEQSSTPPQATGASPEGGQPQKDTSDYEAVLDAGVVSQFFGGKINTGAKLIGALGTAQEETRGKKPTSNFTSFPGASATGKGHGNFMPDTYMERRRKAKQVMKTAGKKPVAKGGANGKPGMVTHSSKAAAREEAVMGINIARMSVSTPPKGAQLNRAATSLGPANAALMQQIQRRREMGPEIRHDAKLVNNETMTALKAGHEKTEDRLFDKQTQNMQSPAIKMMNAPKPPTPSATS